MSSSRLSLTEERLLVEKLRRMQRMASEIKLLQRMSNKSGVIYYEVKSSLNYDAKITLPYDPGVYNGVVKIDTVFATKNQQWPFARSIPKVYLGSITPENQLAPTSYDDSIDVNNLEAPYKLSFSQRFSYGAPSSTVDLFVKCYFYATDDGTFTVNASKL